MKYALYAGWAVLIVCHLAITCLVIMLASEFSAIVGGYLPWIATICIGGLLAESFARLIHTAVSHVNRFSNDSYIP